jgi:hypothetical protein
MKKLDVLMAVVVFAMAGQAHAELVANGDFEAGLEWWGTGGSGSGSGVDGYLAWSGVATIAETGGSDGGQYAVYNTHGLEGHTEDWGWVWLGTWQPEPAEGSTTGPWAITTGQQLAYDGYALDLEAAGTPVQLDFEWRDANGTKIDMNNDGEVNNDDKTRLTLDIVGDDGTTWERINGELTVPAPLGDDTIAKFTAIWWNNTLFTTLGLDQLSLVVDPGVVLLGDVNLDDVVNGLDVDPFVALVTGGTYQAEGDMNADGVVNGLDVDPFVAAVVGGVQQIPEPSTLLLCIIALGVVGGWRKCKRAA